MTELSFLIDLLLNHKLVRETKVLISQRITELGSQDKVMGKSPNIQTLPQHIAGQPPSTLAAMIRHEGLAINQVDRQISMPEVPVTAIAQTAATAAAMASRNQAINESISGKIDKQTGRPRKF